MRALSEGAFPLADSRSRHDLLKFKIFSRFEERVEYVGIDDDVIGDRICEFEILSFG